MEYPGYRKMEQRELQLFQVKVMKRVHDFCVDNNINYYMICGTFLGAIRHKGFIPWDDDMDIALMRDDYNRLIELLPKCFDHDDLCIQSYMTEEHYSPGHARISIGGTIKSQPSWSHYEDHNMQMYIDLFPLDVVPLNKDLQTVQKNQLISIKKRLNRIVYRIHAHNSFATLVLKKMLSTIYGIKGARYWQAKRDKIMTRHNDNPTGIVCSMASHYSYEKQSISVKIYGVPTLYEFDGEQFFGPEHADEYLTHIYGKNYMQIPPVEKRTKPNENFIKI